MGNRVTYFEIASERPEADMKFYREAFGWEFRPSGENHSWVIKTGDRDDPGIDGKLTQKNDTLQQLVNTITVPDIAEAIRRIDQAGGNMVLPKKAVPHVGWVAFFLDPDGNMFGVMEEDKEAE